MTEQEWATSEYHSPRDLLNAGANVIDISNLIGVDEYALSKLRQYVYACRRKEVECYPRHIYTEDANDLRLRQDLEASIIAWAPRLDDCRTYSVFDKVTTSWRCDVVRDIFQNPFKPQYTNLQVGDVVRTRDSLNPLHGGSGIYQVAVVVSINPFVLISIEGDMMWSITRTPHDVIATGDKVDHGPAIKRWNNEKVSFLRSDQGRRTTYRSINRNWLTWQGGIIPSMAKNIIDNEAFEELGVFADALEEAECNDIDIINHCRQHKVHVNGCWVLELFAEAVNTKLV